MNIMDILSSFGGGDAISAMKKATMDAQRGGFPPTPESPPVPGQRPAPEPPPPPPEVPAVVNPQKPEVAAASAYASPPDLSTLYMNMLEESNRSAQLNSGMTLIAAGLTPYQETREKLIGLAAEGGTKGDASGLSSMFNTLDTIRKTNDEMATKNKMRQMLPTLAQKYGLSIESITTMFEGGQLEEFIKEIEKPDRVTATDAVTGETIIVDKKTGKEVSRIGTKKPREIIMMDNPDGTGGQIAVYKDDNTPVAGGPAVTSTKPVGEAEMVPDGKGGTIAAIKTPNGYVRADNGEPIAGSTAPPKYEARANAEGQIQVFDMNTGQPVGEPSGPKTDISTDDMKEYNEFIKAEAAQGKPITPFDTWYKDVLKARQPKTEIKLGGEGELEKELGKKSGERWDADYGEAVESLSTADQIKTAQEQLKKGIIGGSALSPLELSGRKIWADTFGLPDEATTNTEVFQTALKEVVLKKIKALGSGSGISNSDREYVNAAVGGDITMNSESMRKILRIQEKIQINKIKKYNKSVDDFMSDMDDDEKKRFKRLLRKVDVPNLSFDPTDVEDPGVPDTPVSTEPPKGAKKFKIVNGKKVPVE